jgi:hypothetical protein
LRNTAIGRTSPGKGLLARTSFRDELAREPVSPLDAIGRFLLTHQLLAGIAFCRWAGRAAAADE